MEGSRTAVVLGTVIEFDGEKRYGLASMLPDGETVFIHADTLRDVDGSYKDATLSDRRVKRLPPDLILQPACSTMVIMSVVRTKQGLKAEAWGLIPQNNWRIALILQDRMSQFVGGVVVVRSQHGEVQLIGRLEDFDLNPRKLNLTLADARHPSEHVRSKKVLARNLTDASGAKPDFSLIRGRFAIITGSNERITFHTPGDEPKIWPG